MKKYNRYKPKKKGTCSVEEGWYALRTAGRVLLFFCLIGDKKSKFRDIRKKNLTICADKKEKQVNKE